MTAVIHIHQLDDHLPMLNILPGHIALVSHRLGSKANLGEKCKSFQQMII